MESKATRRKLAERYRRLATDRRFKPAQRAEFARLADLWAKTLPGKNTVK